MERTSRQFFVLGLSGIIVAIPVLLAVLWAVIPIVNALHRAGNERSLIVKYRSLSAEEPGYLAALRSARSELLAQNMSDPLVSAELTGASLQNTIQVLAAQAGAQVTSSNMLPSRVVRLLQALSISVSINLPPSNLASFLTAIERQTPFLNVENLNVRSLDNGAGTGMLAVQLQITEYRRIP